MLQVTFDLSDLDRSVELFNKKRLKPLMKSISGDLQDSVEENFEENGRPKWQALATSTVRQKRKRKRSASNILKDSGQLAASIRTSYNETQAFVGTNKIYGRIHQFGGTFTRAARSSIYKQNRFKRGKNKGRFKKGTSLGKGFSYKESNVTIPARPYILLTKDELLLIPQKVAKYFSS